MTDQYYKERCTELERETQYLRAEINRLNNIIADRDMEITMLKKELQELRCL